METKPYLGVTGVTNLEELERVLQSFRRSGFSLESKVVAMIGVLASDKTLIGKKVTNPIYKDRYPKVKDISNLLLKAGEKSFATIHYNNKNPFNLSSELDKLFLKTGVPDGIQLNVKIALISEVEKLKKNHPDLKIIYQANSRILSYSSEEIASTLKLYEDNLDYVLIDPSGGLGMGFNVADSAEIYEKVKTQNPKLQLGFAGGLSGKNVSEIIYEFGVLGIENFSLDAEGELRSISGLNSRRVESYIKAAEKMNY